MSTHKCVNGENYPRVIFNYSSLSPLLPLLPENCGLLQVLKLNRSKQQDLQVDSAERYSNLMCTRNW